MDAADGIRGNAGLIAAGPVGGQGIGAPTLVGRQEGFTAVMARAVRDPRKPAASQAREAAEQFVAMSFVQPLLKQLRESSQAAAPFAPSRGEMQFQSMLDAQVSQQIVHASRLGVVDAVARRLVGSMAAAGTAGGVER